METALIKTLEQREKLSMQIPEGVARIYRIKLNHLKC